MSTSEEFKDLVKGVITRRRLENNAQETARAEFSNSWDKVRSDPIFKVFEDVYSALREVHLNVQHRLENGESAILTVAGKSLIFKRDLKKLRVICTGCQEEEEFEPSSITREQVEITVCRFLESLSPANL